MTQSGPSLRPGWYPDQYAPGVLRWFDGEHWTTHTRSAAAEPSYGAVPYGAIPPTAERPDPLHWVVPVGRRGWAIAAGYVAIVAAFCWLLAPIALGMGIWALVDINRHGGNGKGRAWFAVAVGGVGSLLLLLVAISAISSS